MLFSLIKFLHIICGVSLIGIVIASFYYISMSIRQHDQTLINYSIKTSYFGDAVILLCLIIQFASAIPLIITNKLSLGIPWIFVAFHALALVSLFWLLTILLKKFYLSKSVIPYFALPVYYFLNWAMLFIFIIIVHDAVTKTTIFSFLLEK